MNTSLTLNDIEEIQNQDFSLEECWKNEYDLRRDKWKKHTTIDIRHPVTDPINNSTDTSIVSDGSEMRDALQNNSHTIPIIAQNIPSVTSENTVDIDAIINEYTLNTEQAQAFKLVCKQSLSQQSEPL